MRGFDKIFTEQVAPWLWLAGGLGCLLIAIFAIRSWFHDGKESAAGSETLLIDCREMLARGEITEDEYRKIKSRMLSRTRDSAPAPTPASNLDYTTTSTGDSNSPIVAGESDGDDAKLDT